MRSCQLLPQQSFVLDTFLDLDAQLYQGLLLFPLLGQLVQSKRLCSFSAVHSFHCPRGRCSYDKITTMCAFCQYYLWAYYENLKLEYPVLWAGMKSFPAEGRD